MDQEQIVTELIVNSGNARAKALSAIQYARQGNFKEAEEKMKESKESLEKAHRFQTSLLQKEAAGENKTGFSLLMVHGQDHLMNAMTVRDLAVEIIAMLNERK